MGQKINPISFRLAVSKDWRSKWYATGNDYTDDLVSGNFAACVGWSGDVLQLGKDSPNVRFVIPEEG